MNSKKRIDNQNHIFRVDFSLRKEVFFVTLGSMIGAFTMFIPRMILDVAIGTQYYVVWLVFSRIINSDSIFLGALLHLGVATIIGIITGIVLYKGNFLNISRISSGLLYGIIAGVVVFLVFFIPVQNYLLAPTMMHVLSDINPSLSLDEIRNMVEKDFEKNLIDSVFTHLIWGITTGVISTLFTREFGSRYSCDICDVQFSKTQNVEKHHKYRHVLKDSKITKILILGGGFGGIQILRDLQKSLEDRVDIDISLVSEDNFFLFTPMLPEMATGMIEPRHITTPVRTFCKRARFFEATVNSVDLKSRTVVIKRSYDNQIRTLEYDYLVISLGSKNNFFGNKNLEQNSLTIKTLGDAISIRNHLITMLENADQEEDSNMRSKFLTFVVAGGGFSGVETVGEINDFIRESLSNFYRRISQGEIKVILISATDGILPEIGKDLGDYALESLQKNGVDVIKNTKVVDAGEDYIKLSDGKKIDTSTMIWAGGVAIDPVVQSLDCEHDERGKLVVDGTLRLRQHENVFSLGDCASIFDKNTGKVFPPTAQHAIREAKVVSRNLNLLLKNKKNLRTFDYKTKGTMAKIGKRKGVALLMGNRVRGFLAWLIWRQYYLANLPTREKKFRVALDWFVALFFKPDITRLRNLHEKSLR